MRSTTHAVCCGTKRTIVFAGNDGRWKYDEESGGMEMPGPVGVLKPMELRPGAASLVDEVKLRLSGVANDLEEEANWRSAGVMAACCCVRPPRRADARRSALSPDAMSSALQAKECRVSKDEMVVNKSRSHQMSTRRDPDRQLLENEYFPQPLTTIPQALSRCRSTGNRRPNTGASSAKLS
jgi:hypothetical protein